MCREISFLIKEKGGWCLLVMHWEPNGGWFSTKRATPGNDGSMSDYPVGSPREIVEVHLEVFFCKRTCKNRNPKFLKTQQQKHCKDWKSPVYIGIFLNQQKKHDFFYQHLQTKQQIKRKNATFVGRDGSGLRNWRRHCLQWNCQ